MLFLVKNESPIEELKSPERKIASTPKASVPLVKTPTRSEHTDKKALPIKNKLIIHEQFKNRLPQSVQSGLVKDPGILVTRGHVFLKEVAAIPIKEFNESMGELVQQDKNFVYFRAGENQSYIPVALSKSTNMLYPISSVLHVHGATAGMRSELLNEGYKQYYYHAPLKLLSLQSGPDGVMKTYSELIEKGYNVNLEVLRPGHQTF